MLIMRRLMSRKKTPSPEREYYVLEDRFTDPARLKRERARARELRQTPWWREKISRGLCHYCEQKFPPEKLTLDHVVPLARGGESTRGNCVPACEACNRSKGLETPVEQLLRQISENSSSDPESDQS